MLTTYKPAGGLQDDMPPNFVSILSVSIKFYEKIFDDVLPACWPTSHKSEQIITALIPFVDAFVFGHQH